jgi:hypothetical protein
MPGIHPTTVSLCLKAICRGILSCSSSVSDTVRKLAGEGTYSLFSVVFGFKSGGLSLSDCGGNCVGPSLSVSRKLGLSFACIGFLNGFETVLTVRAEQALALDCQPCLDILQRNTQTLANLNLAPQAICFWVSSSRVLF